MLNYDSFPNSNMIGGLQRYFDHGMMPGSYMTAVLENDLRRACECADDINQHCLFETVKWLYNEAPAGSWGSRENVRAYVARITAASVAELEP